MGRLQVWAPRAAEMVVDVEGKRIPMMRASGGWWCVDSVDIRHGARYGFLPDGGGPFPDPRAMRLPEGVHGPAEMVDHSLFRWTDSDWSPPRFSTRSLIYELHVGTFTNEGTFSAAAGKLDHLISLGVTHVELMPVHSFPGRRGWGYDSVGLFAPLEHYGGPDGLKGFVNACHEAGLAVLLDVVYNHFGPEGNYLGKFGPYTWKEGGTEWGDAVNLDQEGSDEVRLYILDNVRMWLDDYHLDGLRIDAVHALVDRSPRHILREIHDVAQHVETDTNRRKILIAESDLNDPRVVTPVAKGGHGMDAQWSDDFHHALHVQMTGETSGFHKEFEGMEKFARAFGNAFVFDGSFSPGRGRCHGAPPTGLDGRSFLAYIQNHDQVGNRVEGERMASLCSHGMLCIGAALVFVSPHVPMLFHGEEWGATTPFLYFVDLGDEKVAGNVREGRRREFARLGFTLEEVPDPQDETSFLRSKLNWEERHQEKNSELLEWYRCLAQLRRDRYELRSPYFPAVETKFDDGARWIAIRRGRHQILVNFADRRQSIPLFLSCDDAILLANGAIILEKTTQMALLDGETVAILGPP